MERPSDRDRGSPGDGGIGCQDDGVVGWCKDVLRQKERATNRCVDKQRDGSNSTDREADSWCFTYTFKTLHPKRRLTLFLMRFLTCCASVNQSKQTKTPKNSYHMTAPHNPPALFCHYYIVINVSLHISKYRNSNTHDKHTPVMLHTVKRSNKEANKGFQISLFLGVNTEDVHLDDSIRSVSTYLKQSFVLRNTCVCETEAQHLIWW